MQTLGELLKIGRDGQSLTLRQVEEVTGVSNAYLSQLETGKIKKPSANVLYKLATLYGITLDGLLKSCGLVQENEPAIKWDKSLGPLKITNDEEAALLEYLGYLRFKKKVH